ncbi:hypothetical protein [Bacillus sp. AFS040349]|uniref:hypothetical protein n=1 Tax=Bacillus sp. AFS040349 TaxID=2033502 RepID=UPI000BFC82C1|nr:hypothetical protein [Bacillus sp. AFS040349]PGT80568.1 hypothetical protein COD11_20880 [Bacillus sp. AFS040349]
MIELNHSHKNIIINAISQGSSSYQINLHIDKESTTKKVSVLLIFTMLESIGEIVHTMPLVDDIKMEIFNEDDVISVIFVTNETSKDIQLLFNNLPCISSVSIESINSDSHILTTEIQA